MEIYKEMMEGFTEEHKTDEVKPKSECSDLLCSCIDKYSIAEHGNGYALYYGRCNHRHGYNLCFLSEFDNNGEQTRALIERALNRGEICQ
jgi:hypothetical protein